MLVFDLSAEKVFDPKRHVEKIPGKMGEGDVTVACWEPGQFRRSPQRVSLRAQSLCRTARGHFAGRRAGTLQDDARVSTARLRQH